MNLKSKNRSTRLIGVEIETDSVDLSNTYDLSRICSQWGAQITKDGSTDGPEVVLAPTAGQKFLDQVNDICSALDECDAKVSRDCGLHIHTDGGDFSWYDLRRLIIFYSLVEDALYAMCPKSRNPGGSQYRDYCKKIKPSLVTYLIRDDNPKRSKLNIIESLYETSSTKEAKTTKWGSARYYGLNLHSWLFRGTFEFRMPPGTVQSSKIIPWGVIFASIVDFAYKTREEDILELRRKNPKLYGCDKEESSLRLLLCIVPKWVRPWIIKRINKFKRTSRTMEQYEEVVTNWDVYGDPNRGKLPLPVSNDYLIKQIMESTFSRPQTFSFNESINPSKYMRYVREVA